MGVPSTSIRERGGQDADNSSCTERTPLFYSFAYAYKQRDAFRFGAAPLFHLRAAAEEEKLLPFESCQVFLRLPHSYSLLTGVKMYLCASLACGGGTFSGHSKESVDATRFLFCTMRAEERRYTAMVGAFGVLVSNAPFK